MARERFDPNTPVLLAESDQAIRDAFEPIFEEFQFHSVTIEEEGYGVLRADNSNSYGLIVLGSSLAGMSVPKVVAALRSGGENTDTPILIMYNAKDEGIVEKVMEAGATASLKWPVKKSTFLKTLENLLDRRIVLKSDEEELVKQHVGAFLEAAVQVKELRGEGKVEEAEAAFPGILREFFLCAGELYYAKEEHDSAIRIIDEGNKIFPQLGDEFQRRIGKSTSEGARTIPGSDDASPPLAEKIDPGIPVLVADGDLNFLETYKGLFKELQFDNVTFINEGLSVLKEDDSTRFALILLALSFSDMDALKIVAALRAGENNTETPIVLMYGRGQKFSTEEMIRAGATLVLEKSASPEPLRETIESVFGKRIASKSEVQDFSASCIDTASKTVGAVFILKKAGLFKGVESALLDGLFDLFLDTMEVYLSKGDKKSAEDLINHGRNIFPDIRSYFGDRVRELLERGVKFLESDEFDRAKVEFEAALTLNGDDVEAMIGLGESFHCLGNAEGASKSFDRAINSPGASGKPKVLMRLGQIACRYEYYDVALRAYDQLLTTYQLDPRLFYNKALIHVRTREFGKALPLLSRAITLDEKYAPAKALHKKVRIWMSEMPEVELRTD